MALEPKRYRFTTAEYDRLGEVGVLGEDDHVELIEGEIIQMSPIGRSHASRVDRLNRVFNRGVGDAAIVRIQNPIVLGDHSEPEPDLTLLRPRPDFYASEHPTPEEILLVIEVADSSIEYDRQIKAPLYARNRIQELWLLDLGRNHLVVYRDPTGEGYATTRVLRRGEVISPLAFPHLVIPIADILG